MDQTIDAAAAAIESSFRPVPFWSWNDELDIPELLRQIHVMHDAGIGGFFMHARGGLKTPYMGKKWMDCVSACVREAAALGMRAWLYDENGWPSGFGAGAVNAMGMEYQQKNLVFAHASQWNDDENCRLIAFYDTRRKLVEKKEEAAYCAFFKANPFYVDLMDLKVTDAFLGKIHETYWQQLPPDVKENLVGIFTDEPQLSRSGCPWSMILPEEYRKRYGEDLLSVIPDLFFESVTSRRTRVRYYKLCGELFRENFILRISSWCRAHNWLLTGHHVLEERINGQLHSNGSIMRQYSGYDIPGNDHLGRYSSYVVSDVQVVSIAAQYGKRQVMSETFGCSGWNFNMQGKKWLYQQQMVHGINLLCQHLIGYSLHGLRKRDYPASLFEHHPMWEHVKVLHDSFARVGRMLSCGDIECDTLIFHPLSSAWCDAAGGRQFSELAVYCNRAFEELSVFLDKKSLPFHYGDESTLEELGTVSGGRFHVGKMAYRCVVIPPLANISGKVLELLQEFIRQGGAVFYNAGNTNRTVTVDGEFPSEEQSAFLQTLTLWHDESELLSQICTRKIPQLRCRVLEGDAGRVRGTWRSFPEKNERWYFIADFASTLDKKCEDSIALHQYVQTPGTEEKPIPLEVTLPFPAACLELVDQASGEVVKNLDFAETDGKAVFTLSLPSCGSLFIRAVNKSSLAPEELTEGWTVRGLRNVLTIDKVRFKTSGMAEFSDPTDTLTVFNRLLAMPDSEVVLQYAFECSSDLDLDRAELALAVEADENARCFLNGQELEKRFEGFFIDRSIKILGLPREFLKTGVNLFEIRMFFRQSPEVRNALERAKHFESEANKLFFDSEIEAVYLLGNFGTAFEGKRTLEKRNCFFYEGSFKAAKAPETLDMDSFLEGGLTFFSGNVSLQKHFTLSPRAAKEFTKLLLAPFRADSIQLKINGNTLPLICCAPYEADVRGLLKAGENLIELTVSVSPRNTLGPHHTLSAEPCGVGPFSFPMEPDILRRGGVQVTEAYGFIEPGCAFICLV